jgi:hypothetical protein
MGASEFIFYNFKINKTINSVKTFSILIISYLHKKYKYIL